MSRAELKTHALAESRIERQGLPPRAPAPSFMLETSEGHSCSLDDFHGKRVLLVFTDPNCGPCIALMPALVEFYERAPSNLEVIVVGRGDLEANAAKARHHGVGFHTAIQKGWRISKLYGIFATPVAFLVDEKGLISREVAVGLSDIQALLDEIRLSATSTAGNSLRRVATVISRRTLILTGARLGLGGFVMSLIGCGGDRNGTLSGETAYCDGVSYDPAWKCCLDGTLVARWPIENVDACPHLVRSELREAGLAESPARVCPDDVDGRFAAACSTAQACFERCLPAWTHEQCATWFLRDLYAACDGEAACREHAQALHTKSVMTERKFDGETYTLRGKYIQSQMCACCPRGEALCHGSTIDNQSGSTLCGDNGGGGACVGVDLLHSKSNCGQCGHTCAEDEYCNEGDCAKAPCVSSTTPVAHQWRNQNGVYATFCCAQGMLPTTYGACCIPDHDDCGNTNEGINCGCCKPDSADKTKCSQFGG